MIPHPCAVESRRILIADDDPDMRDVLRLALDDQYEVVAVANGFEAIRRLQSEPFDLALLDLSMPIVDGRGVIEEARRRGIGVPVIILSGEKEGARIAAQLQVPTYFAKPVSLRELRAAIVEMLSVRKTTRVRASSGIR